MAVSTLNFIKRCAPRPRTKLRTKRPRKSIIPHHDYDHQDPLAGLTETAAVAARDAAEALFKLGKLNTAIKQAMVAKELNPDLGSTIDNHITAYLVHKAVAKNQTFYQLLFVPNGSAADSETIMREYEKMVWALKPDKNRSVAADGALKHVQAAWEVLSDPLKKLDYDMSLFRDLLTRSQRVDDDTTTGGDIGPNTTFSHWWRYLKIQRNSNPGPGITYYWYYDPN